ncbi:hypothetical protein Krac_11756 [Ktedonobacter racemifer DSM 44963]|uniref:Uncharacterized protein n=1 Tax=Ktedonobacter racemifer DSM 44963 TaxID=485913 RepID=D6TDL6_KTERA|nr:hypothetical protein Krac_11756 [Ktedonobacter racemifer DSM 44963]
MIQVSPQNVNGEKVSVCMQLWQSHSCMHTVHSTQYHERHRRGLAGIAQAGGDTVDGE